MAYSVSDPVVWMGHSYVRVAHYNGGDGMTPTEAKDFGNDSLPEGYQMISINNQDEWDFVVDSLMAGDAWIGLEGNGLDWIWADGTGTEDYANWHTSSAPNPYEGLFVYAKKWDGWYPQDGSILGVCSALYEIPSVSLSRGSWGSIKASF